MGVAIDGDALLLSDTYIQITHFIRGDLVKNIFVGNLDFRTGEDELRQRFEPFGQVGRVSLVTDRDTGRLAGLASSR